MVYSSDEEDRRSEIKRLKINLSILLPPEELIEWSDASSAEPLSPEQLIVHAWPPATINRFPTFRQYLPPNLKRGFIMESFFEYSPIRALLYLSLSSFCKFLHLHRDIPVELIINILEFIRLESPITSPCYDTEYTWHLI
jgi:hypothetical protein